MGKKDRRVEIPDKKARKAAEKEEKESKEAPKIKGCHVSIDVCGGCIRPKDPVPVANSQDGVKMNCSNHHCPFAITHSVHKECFQKLTDKVVSMLLRTGSTSWTDEQRVENAWRKKGLSFVGKFITCPCGHGKQTLEDSENRWSRVGEVVLDHEEYEKNREEKIKKALKHEKPVSTQPKALNCSFGGREQAVLERKLARMEYEKETKFARGDGPSISFPSTAAAKKQPATSYVVPPSIDDDGFTPVGKDGRARETTPASPASASATPDRKGVQPIMSLYVTPPTATHHATPQSGGNRAGRGRTVSSCSTTSWLTTSTQPAKTTDKDRKRGGKREATRGGGGRNKENRNNSSAPKKRATGFAALSGSEDEEEEEEEEETPALQSTMKGLREFADEFHSYSGIGLWSPVEVVELNQHLGLFKCDSALFKCRVSGRKLKEPTIVPQLTVVDMWTFTTQAMAMQKPDIPPGTQLTIQELYAIYYDYEVKHLDDPIIWCRDGTIAPLECVDMTMLTM